MAAPYPNGGTAQPPAASSEEQANGLPVLALMSPPALSHAPVLAPAAPAGRSMRPPSSGAARRGAVQLIPYGTRTDAVWLYRA
jgi:hypothetical protein